MNEEIKQRNRLARHAVVDIYLSGGNGRFYWPNRLEPYHESTPSVRRESHRYIIDSGFGDDGASVEELIDITYERRPDYVIPNDTVRTGSTSMRTAVEETAAKVAEFLDAIDEQSFPATVLVPLQPKHEFHLAYLEEHYPRQANRGHYALGGMRDWSSEAQLNQLEQFREVVGYDAYVHGFGFGSAYEMIRVLRERPALLDSVDFATPVINSKNGEIAGAARKPVYVGPAQGDESATTVAHYILAELCDIARMQSPRLTDGDDLDVDREPFETQLASEESSKSSAPECPEDDDSGPASETATDVSTRSDPPRRPPQSPPPEEVEQETLQLFSE